MPNTARLYALEPTNDSPTVRTVRPRPRLVPVAPAAVQPAAFSPLEEDFFARAADLYPPPGDEAEEWERLFAAVKAGL
jgi:hypothetical protein